MSKIRHILADRHNIAIERVVFDLLGERPRRIVKAGHGGNSRLYRIDMREHRYALKIYPAAVHDPRDRQGTERQALLFFERHGIMQVPRWRGGVQGMSLMDWIDGKPANPPLDHELIDAARFLAAIKDLGSIAEAQSFAPASESCESAAELHRQIEQRRTLLLRHCAENIALEQFFNDDFDPVYARALEWARERLAAAQISFADSQSGVRCLIPADFGFHNALRSADLHLTYIDFEYFGWDDPVKLVADFLLHPGMPLSDAQRLIFKSEMIRVFAGDIRFQDRLAAFLPLFAVRWALIILNEFIPERWAARAVAGNLDSWPMAKARQLIKAEAMMNKARDCLC